MQTKIRKAVGEVQEKKTESGDNKEFIQAMKAGIYDALYYDGRVSYEVYKQLKEML